jgi:hypothetical protein
MNKPTASLNKGVLAISVANSKLPGVVRVDLTAMPLAHFQVRSTDEGSVLGYLDSASRFTPLAVFAERREADRVMAAVQGKLMQAPLPVRIFKTVLIALAVFLALVWVQGYLINVRGNGATPVSSTSSGAKTGVPMDADSRFNDE